MIQEELTTCADLIEPTIGPIFEAMLGIGISPVDARRTEDPKMVRAAVHFSGRWSCAIVLEVTPAQACFFAGRFLSTDVPADLDDNVRDVLGELSNMIAGNLKSAMAPDAVLSMPEVIDGTDVSLRMYGSTAFTRQAFECEAGVFSVCVAVRERLSGSSIRCLSRQ